HDMTLVSEWATRVIVLRNGTVAADLTPRELFDHPDLLAQAHLVPPQITQLGQAAGMSPAPLSVDEFVARFRDRKSTRLNSTHFSHTTLFVSHDMTLVSEWATRVIVLRNGTVAADLTPRELFDHPDLLAQAHLVPPQITQLGQAAGMSPAPLSVDEFVARFRRDDTAILTSPTTLGAEF